MDISISTDGHSSSAGGIALRGGVNTPSFLERMLESAGCCGDLRRTRASVRVSPWRELDVVGLFSLWARCGEV